MSATTELNSGWRWKQRETAAAIGDELQRQGWTAASAIPSEIHLELMKVGRIPDPYIASNEHKVQWVGEREWLYSTTFDYSPTEGNSHVELVFEGLDTLCRIYLVSSPSLSLLYILILCSGLQVAIDNKLLQKSNTLLLHFESAKLRAKELEAKYGRVRAGSSNLGDPSRVYVRKAQYHWRWDWGPEIMCAGPWRPIHLKTYKAVFDIVHAAASVSDKLASTLRIDATLKGDVTSAKFIRTVLRDSAGKVVAEAEKSIADHKKLDGIIKFDLGTDKVALWWPTGNGSQPLYTVETSLLDEKKSVLDVNSQRTGFRRVRVVQEPLKDQKGTTFLFEINNVRIFMGGSNWIPADMFLTRITEANYRKWLELMIEGNQNMIRVWGGGVYEPSIFYDICDELGILVWQDFQFACGVYQTYSDEFIKSVDEEAELNVIRMRRHPSIALWCVERRKKELPAKLFYEKHFPEIVGRLTDNEVPYWPGSPFGGEGWDTSDPTVGDVHQWNVWGGAGIMEFYQNYDILGGRFVSEFGLPSFPDMPTIDYWLDGDKSQRYSQSKLSAQHCKAGAHERRFGILMNENFRPNTDFESHVYLTQLMQSDGVSYAYRIWRRDWKEQGRQYNAGVLVWQLNDCWPVTSWAIVDYFYRIKPVFYTIKREMKPYTVGILREVIKNRWDDRPRQFYEFGAYQSRDAVIDVWATNSTLQERKVKLELEFYDLEAPAWKWSQSHDLVLAPNQATEPKNLQRFKVQYAPEREPVKPESENADLPPTPSYSVVAHVRICDASTGELLSSYSDWPQPPSLNIKKSNDKLTLSVKAPLRPEVKWSDNALDLWPGEEQTVVVDGLGSRKLLVQYLGSEHGTEFSV
ncbi:glycoside hydrolase [Auriculariales sp. MPI-PUGE-AT-0066]|nr:glycoside hydrolase [Auriculariales sp. MPI-PUGE-AT-0066]